MRGNPTNSATVFPHKAADAGELGHLDPHLSAQGHRCGEPGHLDPISPHKATDAREPGHKATDAGNRGQLGHRLNSAPISPHTATDGA